MKHLVSVKEDSPGIWIFVVASIIQQFDSGLQRQKFIFLKKNLSVKLLVTACYKFSTLTKRQQKTNKQTKKHLVWGCNKLLFFLRWSHQRHFTKRFISFFVLQKKKSIIKCSIAKLQHLVYNKRKYAPWWNRVAQAQHFWHHNDRLGINLFPCLLNFPLW